MWVFDGEKWEQDDGPSRRETDRAQGADDRNNEGPFPELQIVEIPLKPQHDNCPPFPFPLP